MSRMRLSFLVIASLTSIIFNTAFCQPEAKLGFHYSQSTGLSIAIQHPAHEKYGCAYPETYQLSLPAGAGGLKAFERHSTGDAWTVLPSKTDTDIFNGIEAVRFDYANGFAYVSAAFSPNSDSIYIRLADDSGNPVFTGFDGICKYYDNRQAAVTVSADDWSNWVVQPGWFPALLNLFRSHGLYVTVGVITRDCSESTWMSLQYQVNAGYIEVASHSRTHPATPYADASGEVGGSMNDILNAVTLSPPFKSGSREYVYTWIAPYGDYDATVDSLMGVYGYLDARLYANLDTTSPREYVYGDSALGAWDPGLGHFYAFFPTVELGAPSWGGGDTSLTSLDSVFDAVVAEGGVYHVMWHPQVIISDTGKTYLNSHLDYIGGRRNIWYANVGSLYLYKFLQDENSTAIDAIAEKPQKPSTFALMQNYPNPFNPSTVISYRLPVSGRVLLKVYDVLGRQTATLVNGVQQAGNHSARFEAGRLAGGVYIYVIQVSTGDGREFKSAKKLMLLK